MSRRTQGKAAEKRQSGEVSGYLVQPMVVGREIIIGGRQDPQFGPVILVGMGGIFVEIFEDVVVRVAPITREGALEMINALRGVQVLKGVRGQLPADLAAVTDALLRLSQLMSDFPGIQEIDINPVAVFNEGDGCIALDARIILKD